MGLPDVVAASTYLDTIYSIECKSSRSTEAYIPQDQLLRCRDVLNMFSKYENRFVVLAFKFAANRAEIKETVSKRTGKKRKKTVRERKLKYYFFLVENTSYFERVEWVKCNDQGLITAKWNVSPAPIFHPLFYKFVTSMEGLRNAVSQRTLVS